MRFWTWYAAMMRGLLPAGLVRDRDGALIVTVGAGGPARLSVRRRGRNVVVGTVDRVTGDALAAGRQGVTIRLAEAGAVLARTVTLPLAAERDLATAVAHEMDALTPFDAAEVYFRIDTLRRDRERGVIRLRLSILPCAAVAPIVALLAARGLTARWIEAAADRDVRFSLGDAVARRGRVRGPAMLCGALGVLCAVIPVVRQQVVLDALAARQRAIAVPLHEASMLRRRLAIARQGDAALAAEERREGDALAALAAITEAVPDGSFLTDVSLRHRMATLDGESPDAAGLVAALAGNRAFADPEFAAPVTRALNARADIFSLKVRLRDGVR